MHSSRDATQTPGRGVRFRYVVGGCALPKEEEGNEGGESSPRHAASARSRISSSRSRRIRKDRGRAVSIFSGDSRRNVSGGPSAAVAPLPPALPLVSPAPRRDT